MFKYLLVIAIILISFTSCSKKSENEKWTAFIYPDKNNTKRNTKLPSFFSKTSQCQKASKEYIKNQNLEKFAMYKCGLNCEYHEGMKVEICEKMIEFK